MISTPDGSGPVRPAMRIYKAENVKPPKKRRGFLRFMLWTFLVLALLGGAGAGAFYLYVRDAVDTITKASTPDDKAGQQQLPPGRVERAGCEAARDLPPDRPGSPQGARREARPLGHADAGARRSQEADRLDAVVPARLDRRHSRPRRAGDHGLLRDRRAAADDRDDPGRHRHHAELLRQRSTSTRSRRPSTRSGAPTSTSTGGTSTRTTTPPRRTSTRSTCSPATS